MTEPEGEALPQQHAPTAAGAGNASWAIDAMPNDRARLATLPADERAAIYLNSIRKMMVFFVVMAVLGIMAGVIIGVVDINTLHNVQQQSPTLGY